MMTVTHTCGHIQNTPGIERLAKLCVERKLKTQEQADQFVREQRDWLEGHVCPECYRKAKGDE